MCEGDFGRAIRQNDSDDFDRFMNPPRGWLVRRPLSGIETKNHSPMISLDAYRGG